MSQQELIAAQPSFNITPTAGWDGVLYSVAVPLTSTEADLWGGTGVQSIDPAVVNYGQALVAIIQLAINGLVVGNTTYVILQTDFGDGVWVDVAWVMWTGNQGSAVFVMTAGGMASVNTAFQQTRQSGQSPSSAAGANVLALGGRIRFVGKSIFVGGSSSLAGLTTSVAATIKYKLMAPR